MRPTELARLQWNCMCINTNGFACVATRSSREDMMQHLMEYHKYDRSDFEHYTHAIVERGGDVPVAQLPEPVEPTNRALELAGV